MKVLVLLLLLGLQGSAGGADCGQDKSLKITKINDVAYQLELCTANCTTLLYYICDDNGLCDYCSKRPGGSTHNCGNLSVCETYNIIESFFSEYATSSPCTLQLTSTTVSTKSNANTPPPDAVLGSLAGYGLLLVILVLIVTGWVWTCWNMKKWKEETQHCKNCQKTKLQKEESNSEEEQFCLNQTHKMTTTQQVVGTAVQQLLDSLEGSGQGVNGLSSNDNKGYCGVNRVENFYTSSEGSSHSSLQEQQRVNRVEEGESGEKHVYHVLEKPGGKDYEEPTKILKKNTTIEYETPVQLNEF